MKNKITFSLILTSVYLFSGDVNITKELASITVKEDGKKIKIERNQNQKHIIHSNFAKTSRACPPFCIQPMHIGNVETIGELELLKNILQMQKDDNKMLLIDVRTRDWFNEGTIPTSINLPFTMLDKDSQYFSKILTLLGAVKEKGNWNFRAVPTMIIFSNGIWDAQASSAIKNLISSGCSEDKILFYRGGMQNWHLLGFTVK